MNSKIFVLCHCLAMQLHKKLLTHWLESSMNLNLLCIWWGVFLTLLKQWGLLYLPITSRGNFSVPSALQPSRTLTLCLISFHHVCQCHTGLEVIEQSSFVNIFISFGWYPSIILGSSSLFQSITVSGFI